MKGYSFGELVKLAEAALPKTDNAVSATKLLNSRAIGGVQFNGTHDISLPGVNLPGNQDTTGRAGVASGADKLTTARRINGVPFDGTSDVTIEAGAVGTYTKAEIDAKDNTRLSLSGGTMQGPLVMASNSKLDGHNWVARDGGSPASYTHYYTDLNGPLTSHAMRFATGNGNFNAFLFQGDGVLRTDSHGYFFSEGRPPSPEQVGAVRAATDNTKVQTKQFGLRIATGYGAGTSGGWARDVQIAGGLDSIKSVAVGGYGSGESVNYGYFGHSDGGPNSYASPNMFRAYETYPAWGENRIFHQGFLPSLNEIGAAPAAHTHNTLDVMSIGNWNTTTEGCGFVQAVGAPNNPTSTNHWYWGINMQHGTGYGMQLISQHGEEKFYIRDKDNSGAGSWARIYTTLNRPTPEEVGALPIGGGMLTGNVHSGTGGFYPNSNGVGELGNSGWRFSQGWINKIVTQDLTAGHCTMAGQDIAIHGKRAVVGYSASNTLYLNFGGDFAGGTSVVGHLWADTISGNSVTGSSRGNSYGSCGIVTNGDSGSLLPMVGFHQPGSFAGTLEMIDTGTFRFMKQDRATRANLQVQDLSIEGNGYASTMRAGQFYVDGWFRANGADSGLHFEQYGGGLHMIDSVWVRTYGGKKFFVDNGEYDAIRTTGGLVTDGDVSCGRNVGVTGDVYAKAFYGNANVDGTGQAVHCPGGIYSKGHNWLYGPVETAGHMINTGSGSILCGNLNASGRVTGAEFTGNGSGLSHITLGQLNVGWVALFSHVGGLSAGNFVLSEPYNNYKQLLIISSPDDNAYRISKIMWSLEVDILQDTGVRYNLIDDLNNHWSGRFDTDKRTFITAQQNSRIHAVYGIR